MFLNAWQRLGAAASVLWVLGGGLWQRMHDTDAAAQAMGAYYRLCTTANPHGDFSKCMDHATAAYTLALNGSWGNVAVTAFGPVILGWLLAYVILWTVRWILTGRRSQAAS